MQYFIRDFRVQYRMDLINLDTDEEFEAFKNTLDFDVVDLIKTEIVATTVCYDLVNKIQDYKDNSVRTTAE